MIDELVAKKRLRLRLSQGGREVDALLSILLFVRGELHLELDGGHGVGEGLLQLDALLQLHMRAHTQRSARGA